MSYELHHTDARSMPMIGDDTVDLIVTSPPYWGLRSYRDGGEHYDGQIGSEDTPQQFVDELVGMIDSEWRRVLKPSGSLWLNLGDKYAGGGVRNNEGFNERWGNSPGNKKQEKGRPASAPVGDARPKSLLGLPWRIALQLIDAGWILRAELIWSKPNGLPESVTDRVRRSHEQWFHLTLEPRYYSAVDEIREEHSPASVERYRHGFDRQKIDPSGESKASHYSTVHGNPLGKLPGSVWTVPTEPLTIPDTTRQALGLVDHYAAFPQEWPRRLILGWSPEDGTVLDPFVGTGTTVGVAHTLGRHGIGIDLSSDYLKLAAWRIEHSGHFHKTEQRTAADRQLTIPLP
jgi:DNA modification methylase